ncbi:MAG: phosphoenolpyruvate carboxykinase (GTP) [Victivallaceae bacterium]
MGFSWELSIKNKSLKSWIQEIAELVTPDSIMVCDGSDQEYEALCRQMVEKGSLIQLNPALRPNSFLARSSPEDVARVEQRTFICSDKKEDAGPTNNWEEPKVMRDRLLKLFKGCMQGRIMYVVPFSMAPIGSTFSVIGVEITDSPYVVCSMKIMTRMGKLALDALGETGRFVKCLHSVGYPLSSGQKDVAWPCSPENTYIAHFQDDYSIMSYGSGYGGNALLGKKCLALRIASYIGKNQGWLAEHMLIIGVTNPEGQKKYFAASFPSACGKTNLAMLSSTLPGWKVECVGDDIAWMRIGFDNRLYAVNPEKGFFGVAPGTAAKTNPNALASCSKNSIFTNVALTSEGDVWWEGLTDVPPEGLIDWLGKPWKPGDKPAAQPNSRFTAPIEQCPVLDPLWNESEGVPIDAIIFGGRRSDTIPLVYEALDWNHGVLIGAGMSSVTTAAIVGKQGELRHDPFAMLPFCGYNMGEYFNHWLSLPLLHNDLKLPKIFGVNWFRKDSEGRFVWPGFGNNVRVLEWIFKRTNQEEGIYQESPIGRLPNQTGLNTEGLDLNEKDFRHLTGIDPLLWKEEMENIRNYLLMFGDKCPSVLLRTIDSIESKLK